MVVNSRIRFANWPSEGTEMAAQGHDYCGAPENATRARRGPGLPPRALEVLQRHLALVAAVTKAELDNVLVALQPPRPSGRRGENRRGPSGIRSGSFSSIVTPSTQTTRLRHRAYCRCSCSPRWGREPFSGNATPPVCDSFEGWTRAEGFYPGQNPDLETNFDSDCVGGRSLSRDGLH